MSGGIFSHGSNLITGLGASNVIVWRRSGISKNTYKYTQIRDLVKYLSDMVLLSIGCSDAPIIGSVIGIGPIMALVDSLITRSADKWHMRIA